MASITISGRLTADPKLRFIPSGDAVASFSVAVNDRKLDKSTGQWVDGEPLFVNVEAWRQLGEGAADKLSRGSVVTVVGTLKPDNWEKNGEQRKSVKIVATEVGLSVRSVKSAAGQSRSSEPVQEPAW